MRLVDPTLVARGALTVTDLTIEYVSGDVTIRPVHNLNLDVPPGSMVLLLGPSGCGKTSLLSCLGRILTPAAGSIGFADRNVSALTGPDLTSYRRHTVGFVFQAYNLVPSLSAVENVEAPLRAAGTPKRQARERAVELLTNLGLEQRLKHLPEQMSGGQQQRVAIARALALDPPLILADEPTAHLDFIQVEELLGVLRRLADDNRVVVIATHDERLIPLADQIIDLSPTGARFGSDEPPVDLNLAANETLFTQGDPADKMFIVNSGSVLLHRELADNTRKLLAVVKPGECFGEFGPLFGAPRSATATADPEHGANITAYTLAGYRSTIGDGPFNEIIRLAARRTAANTLK